MNTTLLIIDIQNDYFEGGRMSLVGTEDASQNAKLILDNFRKKKLPVIHIQHIATRPDATFFLPGTEGSEIHNSIKPIENEKVIVKHFPNSFHKTELLEYLKNKEISDLIICGMMTHMCIDATVRAAKDFEFNCTLIGDACATRNLEINGEIVKAKDVHNAFLSALNGFYAKVVKIGEFL
jgi:nicotinamidase-related amidase